ncbi:MAG TPA: MOSC domain-containing protein [Candidatus Binatia bacterium]|nr:MOSC domain-containing protein [Candidatus Binatia bacterium]
MTGTGIVASLHIAPVGAAPMQSVRRVNAVVDRGLEGDRYFSQSGTYSSDPGTGRHVTLIEIEAIEGLKREYGVALEAALSRRNIVTRGVALNHLVEKSFRVGAAVLRGTRLCEPCSHMEKLTVKGAMRGLIHRGGLRAEIVSGGMIRVGDSILMTES